jgi:hypothetical protein
VNSHRIVEIALPSAHLDGDREALGNFVAPLSNDMDSHNFLLLAHTNEFVYCWLLFLGLEHGKVERHKATKVYLDGRIAVLLASFGLGLQQVTCEQMLT